MKLKKLLVTGMALLASVTAFTSVAQAATSSQVQKVIDESYVQPDYVMGYSLSEEQRNETLNLLGYDSSKDTNVKTLTTSAYANIMNAAACPCPTRSWQSSRPWATSTTTSPHTSEAEHHERDPRPVPRPDAGTHVSAESPAGCRGRLA